MFTQFTMHHGGILGEKPRKVAVPAWSIQAVEEAERCTVIVSSREGITQRYNVVEGLDQCLEMIDRDLRGASDALLVNLGGAEQLKGLENRLERAILKRLDSITDEKIGTHLRRLAARTEAMASPAEPEPHPEPVTKKK